SRHQRDALQELASRLGGDLDLALQRILANGAELRVTALEQREEDVAEVDLHLLERLDEHAAGRDVDLLDRFEQLGPRALQIFPLAREELPAILLPRVLLERQEIHGPQRAQALPGLLELAAGRLRVEVLGRRLRRPRLDVQLVLGAQALERA